MGCNNCSSTSLANEAVNYKDMHANVQYKLLSRAKTVHLMEIVTFLHKQTSDHFWIVSMNKFSMKAAARKTTILFLCYYKFHLFS